MVLKASFMLSMEFIFLIFAIYKIQVFSFSNNIDSSETNKDSQDLEHSHSPACTLSGVLDWYDTNESVGTEGKKDHQRCRFSSVLEY